MMMDYEDNESCMFDKLLNLSNDYEVECGRDDTVRETNRRYRKSNLISHKIVHVEIDPLHKSDREEWGTSHYHRYYNPVAAFELTVEWLVATGMILSELVASWARRSNQFGFHFVPVPGDPFTLPFTANSDPLRGPIFVPLNIKCLLGKERGEEEEEGEGDEASKRELFDEFPVESRGERIALFQVGQFVVHCASLLECLLLLTINSVVIKKN